MTMMMSLFTNNTNQPVNTVNNTFNPNPTVAPRTTASAAPRTTVPAGENTDYSQVKVSGQNYYVDSVNGSDSNNGLTPGTAFKTLNKVNQLNLDAGDAVNFAAGSNFNGQLNINDSGTADNPILFRSYGDGAKPVFTNSGEWSRCINVNADYTVIDGLSLQGAHLAGIFIGDESDHNVVSNCEATNTGSGVVVRGQNNLITQNYIHDLNMVQNTQGGDDDFGATGVWLYNSGNEVSYNLMERCQAPSYDYGMDGGAVEIYGGNASDVINGSYIHDNTAIDTNGFMEIGKGTITNTLVENNNYTGDTGFSWVHLGGTFGANVSNYQVKNNTITTEDTGRIIGYNGTPAPGAIIQENNTVYQR